MITRIVTIVFFVISSVSIIAFARGYRLDIANSTLTSTGLVSVASVPRSAKVYVNGELKGITDLNLNLSPGEYVFTVSKEGYFPWQKKVKIRGEIVQSLAATLYPITSSLTPLTNIGIAKAVPLGTQSDKVILFSSKKSLLVDTPVPSSSEAELVGSEAGIYIYDAGRRMVSLLPNLQKIISYTDIDPEVAPNDLEFILAPDGKQMAVFVLDPNRANPTPSVHHTEYYPKYEVPTTYLKAVLVNIDDSNVGPLNITDTVESLIDAWTQQKEKQLLTLTGSLEKPLGAFIKNNTRILDISPDKTKVLYEATATATLQPILATPLIGSNQTEEFRTLEKKQVYVYDIKEDRNYLVSDKKSNVRNRIIFHPNSKNLVFDEGKSINIADFDGLNKQKVYSGPFDTLFFAMVSDGRLLILTNLNPELNVYGDLYAIGIL
ncbi:MAG: PEGA domain-containing protein [bacterium]